jgi:hypothetical protein
MGPAEAAASHRHQNLLLPPQSKRAVRSGAFFLFALEARETSSMTQTDSASQFGKANP